MRGDIFRLLQAATTVYSSLEGEGEGEGGARRSGVPSPGMSGPADYRLLQAGICCAVYIQISDFLKKYLQRG